MMWGKRKSEKAFLVERFSRQIESREGRHSIRVRIQVNPFEDNKRDVNNEQWQDITEGRVRSLNGKTDFIFVVEFRLGRSRERAFGFL